MADDRLMVRTLRGMWPNLPALLTASAATCAAAVLPVLAAPGVNPVALLLAAVSIGPFAAALAATVNTIALDGGASPGTWWRALRRLWLFGVRQALLVAAVAVLFLAALEVWSRYRTAWVLPSLALTGAATVLGGLGLLAVLPLGTARERLRGYQLWVTALHLVARRPVRFLAPLCVVGLGIWAGTAIGAALLLLVPAPATVTMVLATWTSVSDMTARPAPDVPWPTRRRDRPARGDRRAPARLRSAGGGTR